MIVPKEELKTTKELRKNLPIKNVLDIVSEKLGKELPRINKVILSDNQG